MAYSQSNLNTIVINGQVQATHANIDDVRSKYYEGDHFGYFQSAFATNLPPTERDLVLLKLREIFVSANLTKECVDRHVDSLVGNLPTYDVTPITDPVLDEDTTVTTNNGTNSLLKEAHKDLHNWVDFVLKNSLLSLDNTKYLNPIIKP